jgi:putative nucleotidyltransferase with HDIG domain
MAGENTDDRTRSQIELLLRELDQLSILPCVGAKLFAEVPAWKSHSLPASLAEIIESDPSLAVRLLSLMHEKGFGFGAGDISIRRAIDKLGPAVVRDGLLSAEVILPVENGNGQDRLSRRILLIQHSIAVACCASDIAKIVSPAVDSETAYLAGLLHDIAKLAMEQIMPKSFARIAEQAKIENSSALRVEQKLLGLDHTILGKRLAQQWHLPQEIVFAIWFHHIDSAALSDSLAETRIAKIVQLADMVARQCELGQSGSYDVPKNVDEIAMSLGIEAGQLQELRDGLADKVEKRCSTLGLEMPNAVGDYCKSVHDTAAQLSGSNNTLAEQVRNMQADSSHFGFIRDFLLSTDPNGLAIEAAGNFASRWQKFYQTGMAFIYLIEPGSSRKIDAVVIETIEKSRVVTLNVPSDVPLIPRDIEDKFAILDAADHTGWLFEQLEVQFDLDESKIVPLLSAGKAVGALIFELRYPQDVERFADHFAAAASVGGAVLDMLVSSSRQERLTEHFAQLFTVLKSPEPEPEPVVKAEPEQEAAPSQSPGSLDALAEMAAGAAHELNNPLSVISGRAQLLSAGETDPDKSRMLRQIRENAGDISAIIEDLMAFANPQTPKPEQTAVKPILNDAVQFAAQKAETDHINVQLEVGDDVPEIFVDSSQIVPAIANIICNSLESYKDKTGPIKIVAEADSTADVVNVQVSDLGRGMDSATIGKASQPFFSAHSAGRKRGMGLSHAQRLVELNKGRLEIQSDADGGTTVTVSLPCH